MTPILADWSEIAKMEEALDNGEQYTPDGIVADTPDNFNQWKKDNAGKIAQAEDRGTLPYFLRDNGKYRGVGKESENILGNSMQPSKPLTILERAELRHNARTLQQIQKIKDEWTVHNIRNSIGKINDNGGVIKKFDDILHNKQLSSADKIRKIEVIAQMRNAEALKTNKQALTAAQNYSRGKGKSKVIGNLLNRYNNAKSETDKLFILEDIKTACGKKMLWDYSRAGIANGFKMEGIRSNYKLYTGASYKVGNKTIKVKDYDVNLVEFKKDGISVYYEIGTDPQKANVNANEIYKHLQSRPQYMTDNFGGIVSCNKWHPLDAYYKVVYPNFQHGALYSGTPITCHVKLGVDINIEAVDHEIGHHIDDKKNASNQQWKDAISKDKYMPTTYAGTNEHEDFAESIQEYLSKGEQYFKQWYPNRWKVLVSILKSL